MRRFRALALPCALALPLAAAPAAHAQDPPIEDRDLPRRVEARLRALLDDSAAVRYDGPTRIDAGRTIPGPVTAFGGPFTLAGEVDGDLVVIDGDLVFEPGGAVTGDVTVVGGTARGVEAAAIAGTLTVYGQGFAEAERPRRRTRRDDDDPWWWDRDERRIGERGGARLLVRPGAGYNRVEGLPIRFGPLVQTRGANPLRLRALAIWRTENRDGFDRDDIGYSLRAEQFLGGRRELSVGADAYSVVDPIEAWRVRHLEAGLSTFVLHEDPRDQFERTGWRAFARYTPRAHPLDATLEFRSDEYGIAPVNDPYALFGDDPWRLQPHVAAGRLDAIAVRAIWDMRDDDDFPTRGWYLEAAALRGIRGVLEVPAFAVPALLPPADIVTVTAAQRFDGDEIAHLFVDARRYERAGSDGLLAFRVVAGGTPLDRPLPPQFQHALGGAGSVPGFDRFALDCGARAVRVATSVGDFHPFYGCDRFALFQAEYIGRIDLGFDLDPDDDYDDSDDWWDGAWDWDGDLTPAWAAFFDAARGWTLRDADGAAGATDTGTSYDIGGGLLVGEIGLYAALPLNGPDDGVRVILRLGRRF